MSGRYVVAIKPSARRINAVACEHVGRRGSTRPFASKADAREWAAAISDDDGAVRVQDTPPHDAGEADGYLVADPARRRPGEHPAEPTPLTFGDFEPDG